MIGPIIGAVGSILGGALGGRTKQKGRSRSTSSSVSTSHSRNKVRLGQMVAAAERHGFNPLTFLRSGGLAAFTDTTTTSASKGKSFSKSKGGSQSSAPLGAGIAQAAQIIGGAVENGPSPQSGATRDAWAAGPVGAKAEMDLVNSQLAQVKPGAFGDQPQHRASQVYKKDKPALGQEVYDGSPMVPEKENSEITNPYPADWGLRVDPLVPNGGTRYQGEIAENIGDAVTAYRDLKFNVVNSDTGKAIDKWWAGYRGGDISRAALDAVKTNVWDPIAIKLYSPQHVRQYEVPLPMNHYKKPEFVDGGPKW